MSSITKASLMAQIQQDFNAGNIQAAEEAEAEMQALIAEQQEVTGLGSAKTAGQALQAQGEAGLNSGISFGGLAGGIGALGNDPEQTNEASKVINDASNPNTQLV